jgi:hypothetical protein
MRLYDPAIVGRSMLRPCHYSANTFVTILG